jgi:hypothetical protein
LLDIHNIYNPSPVSYISRELGTIGALREVLENSAAGRNYLVVGDLNLYHP